MQIESYSATYTGKKSGSTFWRAWIHLTNPSDDYIGGIYFYDDALSPPNNDGYISDYLFMFLPASHFARIMDLLRNEQPLYFTFSEGAEKTYLSTSSEPVGEGELAP